MLWCALVSYEAFYDRFSAVADRLLEGLCVSVRVLCELAVFSSAIYFYCCVFKLPSCATPTDLLGFIIKPEFLVFDEACRLELELQAPDLRRSS